jgi:hypothetical protein
MKIFSSVSAVLVFFSCAYTAFAQQQIVTNGDRFVYCTKLVDDLPQAVVMNPTKFECMPLFQALQKVRDDVDVEELSEEERGALNRFLEKN